MYTQQMDFEFGNIVPEVNAEYASAEGKSLVSIGREVGQTIRELEQQANKEKSLLPVVIVGGSALLIVGLVGLAVYLKLR